MLKASIWRRAAACLLAGATALGAAAQTPPAFPSGPITIVVGFTPGGSNDVIARAIAPKLGEILGVPVLVENRPGASGSIAAAYTINAKPDGSVVTLGSSSVFSVGPHTIPGLPYKESDLQAVNTVAASTGVIAINPKLPAKTMADLIALAKTRRVSVASAGAGGVSHLNIELLRQETGGDFLHVAYKGAAPGITDVIGGQVDGIIMDYSALQGMINQGRLRAVAASNPVDKIATSPMVITPWYAVMTSAKVPKANVKILHDALSKALTDPGVKASLQKYSIEPFPQPTAEEADTYIRADSERWGKVVKTSGLKFD